MNPDQPPICDYEGSDYQTSFWDESDRAYEDQVEAIAIHRLLPESGELLLEIGAGAGRNTPRYKAYQRVVLVDYSSTQLQQAQTYLGTSDRYIYVAANAYQLPFVTGVFDGATMIRTLHHMAEPQLAIEQVRLALQPGATFILEYANKHNLKAILRYIFRQQSWSPFTPEAVEFTTLNFDFHPKSVRNWLETSGFSVERQLTVSHFRIDTLKRLFPLDMLVKLDSIAQLSGNWWQLSPSVFVLASAVGDTAIAPPGALFRCLLCDHNQLEQTVDSLICPNCRHHWNYENGIYDFRLK
ncbi:MAG: class I SAM-dependent methyltransferase [Chloroflexi bacterium]|nr:class I SAM-dependent methyltransferase [Chloroflexota bacterium]